MYDNENALEAAIYRYYIEGYRSHEFIEPLRAGRYAPMPERYAGTKLGDYLSANAPDGIYLHQAVAGDLLNQDKNVVLTTGTGSGKSRVFMAEAFHRIMADPDARVEVFYPLKALGHDQYEKWAAMARDLGLPSDVVATIDGQVKTDERLSRLQNGRIMLMTPDVVHAWMMTNIDNAVVQEYIRNRRLTVLDEIDSYNGLFGTNMLFLLKRLEDAQAQLDRAFFRNEDHRFIATSATLPDAAGFFEQLTGYPATVIGEDQNGAPQKERKVLHHAMRWESRYKVTERLIEHFIDSNYPGQAIVFFDSRRDVEDMAARINQRFARADGHEVAIPQKAGYSPDEQARLEKRLRSGDAKVVIATSAWESGIDFDFSLGINVGEPITKKSARQRVGRIGRHQEGLFVYVAPPEAFKINQDIKNIADYMEKAGLEMPKLYPQNEFIQIAQAFCHANEQEKLVRSGTKLFKPMEKTKWPRGFITACDQVANPHKNLADEKKILIPPRWAKNKPQKFHSLRNMSGSSFLLTTASGNEPPKMAGSCDLMHALEEYPPGAIVRHAGQRRRVTRWETINGHDRIIMAPYNGPNKTRHMIRDEAVINLNSRNIVEGHYYEFTGPDLKPVRAKKKTVEQDGLDDESSDEAITSPIKPFMALVRGRLTRVVSSFIEITPDGKVYPYSYHDDHELQDLKEKFGEGAFDYGPKRRVRMSTTGFLLHLPTHWFGSHGRTELAEKILDIYSTLSNINRGDLGYAAKNVLVKTTEGQKVDSHLLYIFDKTPGSIGLSHGLLADRMNSIMGLLRPMALSYDRQKERYDIRRIQDLGLALRYMRQVEPKAALEKAQTYPKLPRHHYFMIAPGSIALHEESNGSSTLVKVVKPVMAGDTPGYLIEKVQRRQYFSGSKYVFAEVTREGVKINGQAADGAKEEVQSSMIKHFVPANQLTLERGKRVGMDMKSGGLVEVFEKAAINGVKQFDWRPMKLSAEIESLKLDMKS